MHSDHRGLGRAPHPTVLGKVWTTFPGPLLGSGGEDRAGHRMLEGVEDAAGDPTLEPQTRDRKWDRWGLTVATQALGCSSLLAHWRCGGLQVSCGCSEGPEHPHPRPRGGGVREDSLKLPAGEPGSPEL